MIAASLLLASVVAVWLGWRLEAILDQRGTFRLAQAKIKWDTKLEIARLSLPQPVAHVQDNALAIAQIQADALRDVARIQHPESPPAKPALREVKLPDDLEAHVMQWQDEWARDDERGALRKLYLEYHDGDETSTWRKVRAAARIAELGGE